MCVNIKLMMSLSPELGAAIMWTTKGLVCLYIIMIALVDVDQWGFYMQSDASKLLFLGFIITSFFADTGLFLLSSVAFILTMVRLESANMKPDEESYEDTVDTKPPVGYEYVVAESKTREQKEGFKGNVNASLPSQTEPTAPMTQPPETTQPPQPQPESETTQITPSPITPSTLVSREKTSDVTGKTFDDPAQQALQKYAIETSLEKASLDGIIKSNYNKFMYPLGQQYNIQGITEGIVGYNYF